MVRRLIPLPMTDENLQLTIIDGILFPEMAQTLRIRSVPTILLDDRFRWTGSVPLEELIDTINTRDPVAMGSAALESIIKEGGAGRLAAMMLEAEKLFPAFMMFSPMIDGRYAWEPWWLSKKLLPKTGISQRRHSTPYGTVFMGPPSQFKETSSLF